MAGRGQVQPVDRLLLPAVSASLAALDLDPRDQGAARLAELLARRIDAAAGAAANADRVLREAAASGDDALIEQVSALKAKLAEQVCLKDLGLRLESVLVQLGGTPKARAGAGAPASVSGTSKLALLRGGGAS